MLRQSLDNPPIERNDFCKIMVIFCTKMKEKLQMSKIMLIFARSINKIFILNHEYFEGVKK